MLKLFIILIKLLEFKSKNLIFPSSWAETIFPFENRILLGYD